MEFVYRVHDSLHTYSILTYLWTGVLDTARLMAAGGLASPNVAEHVAEHVEADDWREARKSTMSDKMVAATA